MQGLPLFKELCKLLNSFLMVLLLLGKSQLLLLLLFKNLGLVLGQGLMLCLLQDKNLGMLLVKRLLLLLLLGKNLSNNLLLLGKDLLHPGQGQGVRGGSRGLRRVRGCGRSRGRRHSYMNDREIHIH